VARRLRVESVALEELGESAVYLDDQQAGLGDELTSEIHGVFAEILDRPETFQVLGTWFGHEVRSALATRFKFRVAFVVRPRTVWVISVARQRRGVYWGSRLKNPPPE
jgi:hypothetical protein